MKVTHDVVRRLRRAVTVLDETTFRGHFPATDLETHWYTPATREVETRRLMEQVDRTLWRRATFVQPDVTVQGPTDRVTVRGMDTLVQCGLRPARGVEHLEDGFHLIARERIPALFHLLTDGLLEALVFFTRLVLHWLLR